MAKNPHRWKFHRIGGLEQVSLDTASALESLGRALGPIWGNASLQRFGEATPYLSAAVFLLMTLAMSVGYQVPEADSNLV